MIKENLNHSNLQSNFIVYKATNIINDKFYIGVTKKSLHKRKISHFNNSKGGANKFGRAIRKYGWDNFKWEIIDTDANSINNLAKLEIWYIEHLKPEYNSTKGGDGTSGYRHTIESKGKISQRFKGLTLTVDHKKKISKAHLGKNRGPMPQEQKDKISTTSRGKIFSIETRAKISLANTKRVWTEESKLRISITKKARNKAKIYVTNIL